MRLKDINVTGNARSAVKATDVDRFEKEFWVTFPKGYREFITRFGEGILANFVRIYPPRRIQSELEEWRERIREYWFWDAGRKLLPKSRALECFILGDTVNGDELAFHPARPGHLFVLPRDSEKIFDAGAALLDALEFLSRSGKLTEPIADLTFEPFDSRKTLAAEKQSGEKKNFGPSRRVLQRSSATSRAMGQAARLPQRRQGAH